MAGTKRKNNEEYPKERRTKIVAKNTSTRRKDDKDNNDERRTMMTPNNTNTRNEDERRTMTSSDSVDGI
jgi:hypothetical protein